MRTYAASGNRTLATTTNNKTILQVAQPASALKRIAVTYCEFHSDATADNAYTIQVQRITAVGSGGTAFTPTILDPADGAASAVARIADTTDPTITASSQLLQLGGHQRATVMWYAPPGGEIIIPATNSVGIATVCTVVSAGFNQVQTVHWTE